MMLKLCKAWNQKLRLASEFTESARKRQLCASKTYCVWIVQEFT